MLVQPRPIKTYGRPSVIRVEGTSRAKVSVIIRCSSPSACTQSHVARYSRRRVTYAPRSRVSYAPRSRRSYAPRSRRASCNSLLRSRHSIA
eukprot:513329-Rhodomonas_salina.2